ncbi:MAG TPA: hypothetical protein EYG73_00490 [Arcobacter sp.]|nr:hypothetical protein [Arcobacter sp.]
MKSFLLIVILFTTFLWAPPIGTYNKGGSIDDIEQNIVKLEEQQKKIEEHLQEISSLLKDYNSFAGSYLSRIQSILEHGADCLIAEQEYLYYDKAMGPNSDYTLMHKKFKDDCNLMKEERIKSLEGLDRKFTGLASKVKELRLQQKIDGKKEARIMKNIQRLKDDRISIMGGGR